MVLAVPAKLICIPPPTIPLLLFPSLSHPPSSPLSLSLTLTPSLPLPLPQVQRSLYIRILLSMGFSTLNSDLDMVLLQDPKPYISNRSFDMVVTFDGMWNELLDCMPGWTGTKDYFDIGLPGPGYINNGFMLMRPTEATMKVCWPCCCRCDALQGSCSSPCACRNECLPAIGEAE